MAHHKIDGVARSKFVFLAFHSLAVAGGLKERPSKKFYIGGRDLKCCSEDTALVAPARVSRAQAVVTELLNIDDRILAAGQLHPKTGLQLRRVISPARANDQILPVLRLHRHRMI